MEKTSRSDSKNLQPKNDPRLSGSRSSSRQGRSSINIRNKFEIAGSNNISKTIQDSIAKIFELYDQLNTVIKHLDNKIEKVIPNQDKDYLSAFKYLSNAVQKELEVLKKRADEMCEKSLKEEKFQELEYQLDFYKNEANKYYVAADTNMKVVQDFKKRFKEIEEENQFIKEQIKANTRESKQIKKEYLTLLEEVNVLKIKNQQYEKEIMTIGDQSTLVQANAIKISKYDSAKTIHETDSTSGSRATSPIRAFGTHTAFITKMMEDYIERHKNAGKLVDELIIYVRKCEDVKFTQVEKMKEMLQNERKEKMKLNQYITSTLAEISDYELLFVECVKCVKAEILKRSNGIMSNQQVDVSNIKNFISLDKIRIIELFVMTEKVLLGIYELMFPANKFQINELLKPIPEQTKSEIDSSEEQCNTSEVISQQDILKGDKSDFNQSYHFENLMVLKKNKHDLNIMIATPNSSNKSLLVSRRPSTEALASIKLNN